VKKEEYGDVDGQRANFGKKNPDVVEVESVCFIGLVDPTLYSLRQ